MQPGFEEQMERIYAILGNPYKRKIISLLGEKGEVSFTELKNFLATSTGNLYYNLDGLAGFVAKNEKRKYYLTSEGERLYRFMIENEARLRSLIKGSGASHSFQQYIQRILVPEELLAVLYGQKILSIAVLAVSLAMIAITSLVSRQVCFMLEALSVGYASPPLALALSSSGMGCLLCVLAVASRLLGGAGRVTFNFVGMVALSLLPLQAAVAAGAFIEDPLLRSLLHRGVQVVTLGFMTAAVKVSERLPGDRAFISVFAAFYVSYFTSLVVQRLIL
ncbi:MAG: helix-turn-helix domain-containing protein [Thermofilum sp.]